MDIATLEAVRETNQQTAIDQARTQNQPYHFISNATQSTDILLEAIEDSDNRYRLGIPQLDVLTRGFGAQELVLVLGFSHSGKTQLFLSSIHRNPDKHVLFFSFDDSAPLVTQRLLCMSLGISGEEMEERLKDGDKLLRNEMYQLARTQLNNFEIVDRSLSLGQMATAVEEATEKWGEPPAIIAVDYLSLVPNQDMSNEPVNQIPQKTQMLKSWCKDLPCPLLVIHQNTRGVGGPGQPITMLSGAYGGEQEATFVLGVRRKSDNEELHQREKWANTITVHIAKNKRPPGLRTPRDGIDLYMDPATGLIRPLRVSDLPG
jgi:replicative DNA helicase